MALCTQTTTTVLAYKYHTAYRPQSSLEQLADNVVHHWGCHQSQLQGAGAQVMYLVSSKEDRK